MQVILVVTLSLLILLSPLYWYVTVPALLLLIGGLKVQDNIKSKREAEARALAAKAIADEEARAIEEAEAAAARRSAYYQTRWANDVNLGAEDVARIIAAADGIVPQVDAENRHIESRLRALANLLVDGVKKMPSAPRLEELPLSYQQGDANGIAAYATSVLDSMPLPKGMHTTAKVAYTPESRQLVVEYELPTVNMIPKAKSYRYIQSRDRLAETGRPAAQTKSLYASVIAQLSLLCLAHVFACDREGHIDVVVFNGVVQTLDPRSGRPVRPCLLTVRVTRDTFSELDLAHVDPPACLKHLSASVSRSPAELSPVRPLIEFSMVDPRFVTETDTLSAMDSRPNLMELTPREFESLIQNLFTSMGLEAKQTRASRDGGVDCVAYDTRPIFGGKVVIQAKRYKNTVGVSAVRDLFGTLQNEGASKGILVTTSGYGKASFEFAQNKPIELLDGGNLLYLLEEHTGVKAKIEMPVDWRDPVPDAPDA
jgi:HJR/Mrr/RecB family endonuclease